MKAAKSAAAQEIKDASAVYAIGRVGELLPLGWAMATLKDIGEIASGGTPKTSDPENFDGEIPWVTPADLTGYTAKNISSGRRNITQQGLGTSSAKLLPERTVIFSSRAPIGYVAIATNPLATNQGFKNVVPHADFDESYLYHYLKSAKALAESNASGTTFKEISKTRFGQLPIPVAPLNEQHRIVEKIDQLFAELDQGEAALRHTLTLLKRYRQSQLLAAVTGELTADWRREHQGKFETGEQLLERILKARREHWEAEQLAKMEAKGKPPKTDAWKNKYKAPAEPDTANLPELPEGWGFATIDQLSISVDYGSSKKSSKSDIGVPVLRMGDIINGRLNFDNLKYLPRDSSEFPKLLLQDGDLLFNRTNSAELVGKTAVYHEELPECSYVSYLIRVRLSETEPDYVAAFINSVFGSQWIKRVVSQQVGQANVNGTKLKALTVPLPPLKEQKYIVEAIGEAIQQIEQLETHCQTELTRSKALRQSILKDAFAGKLVPQDPNDEPASALLARIQAERRGKGKK